MAKTPTDWHPADVQAALKKAGWTLRAVGEAAGYKAPESAKHVLRIRMPRVEAKIAEILDKPVTAIWPSRYDHEGNPKGWRGRRWLMEARSSACNDQTDGPA